MNIARAVLDGLHEDQVRQLDYGGFFARSGKLIEVDFFDGFPGNLDIIRIRIILGFVFGFLNDVLHAAALGGIDAVEFVDDRLFRSDHGENFEPGNALNVVQGEDVERIGHRQVKPVVEARDGDHFVGVSQFPGEKVRDFDGNGDAGKIDRRRVQNASNGHRHVLLAYVSFFQDQLKK